MVSCCCHSENNFLTQNMTKLKSIICIIYKFISLLFPYSLLIYEQFINFWDQLKIREIHKIQRGKKFVHVYLKYSYDYRKMFYSFLTQLPTPFSYQTFVHCFYAHFKEVHFWEHFSQKITKNKEYFRSRKMYLLLIPT